MQKIAFLAILAAMSLTGNEAQANQRRLRPQISSGQGPVNRLVEFERRKNAALRQAFLGR